MWQNSAKTWYVSTARWSFVIVLFIPSNLCRWPCFSLTPVPQAIGKIYPYLVRLFEPIRTSVTTTLPILQSSVLLPHNQPLYQFLAMHAPRVAIEVQLAYINAARLYYETAFRRYVRELRRILQRWIEPASLVASAHKHPDAQYAAERQQYARPLTDVAAVLACQSEDVNFRASPEHLFHTLALVFLDTACTEYAFLARFFAGTEMRHDVYDASGVPTYNLLSLSPEEERLHESIVTRESWLQVMEPAISYFSEFHDAVLTMPSAPVLQHLTISNLTQSLLRVAQSRRCLIPELESVLMRHVLETWPLVAKGLDAEVDALKAVAVGARLSAAPRSSGAAGFFDRWSGLAMTTDLSRINASDALHKVGILVHDYVGCQLTRAAPDPFCLHTFFHASGRRNSC